MGKFLKLLVMTLRTSMLYSSLLNEMHLRENQEIPYEESSKHGENCYHHSSFNNNHQPFTDSSGWNHFPKIEVNKFNGSDPVGWVSQMGHYFSLHNITDDMAKLRVAILYLDYERWEWWQWYKKAYGGCIAWTPFSKVVTTHFDKESHFWGA